jgi:hypothetical protein
MSSTRATCPSAINLLIASMRVVIARESPQHEAVKQVVSLLVLRV